MTTAIGARCPDGILLFTDTLETTENGEKGFTPKVRHLKNGKFAIACAGGSNDIDLFSSYLAVKFQQDNTEYDENELLIKLHNIVVEYKGELVRSSQPAANDDVMEYDCQVLLGACLKSEQFALYKIRIQNFHPKDIGTRDVRLVSDTITTIGTGQTMADTLIAIFQRYLGRLHERNIDYKLMSVICEYLISMVSQRDPNTNTYFNAALVDGKKTRPFYTNEVTFSGNSIEAKIVNEITRRFPDVKNNLKNILGGALR